MKLVIASGNAGKIREIRAILGGEFDPILSMKEAGIDHETVEDGETFMENALKKAREMAEISGTAALADDSGLCVDALGGAPGVFSARFCGRHGDDEANNDLLLEKLRGVKNRRAHYACAMALVFPDGREITAEGIFEGEIGFERKGTGGFGYDPLFYLPDYKMTVAQMDADEKNRISHRAKALQGLLRKLKSPEKP